MKLEAIKASAKASLAHAKQLVNKKSPEIWLGVGITCIVGGTILACKASRKLDRIMDLHEFEKEEIENARQDTIDADNNTIQLAEEDRLEEADYKKEKAMLVISTGSEIAREYAPAVILIAAGIGMTIHSHNILTRRNVALLTAYKSLDEAFTKYRTAVRERFGKEVDEELYSGRVVTTKTHTEKDADGKKTKVTEQTVAIGEGTDPYAALFDEINSTEWTRSPDYNLTTLKVQENQWNNTLIARKMDGRNKRGFVFLNEVRKSLGLPETPTGAICGWVTAIDGEEPEGDEYISFGLDFEHGGEQIIPFLNGDEPNVWLHFNCQGVIWDKI